MLFNNEQVMVSAWIQLFILFKSNDNKRARWNDWNCDSYSEIEGKFQNKKREFDWAI